MAKPPYIVPRDLADLPHLMAVGCVLALAGYGRTTLNARIAAGLMPGPMGRGRDGKLFNRDAVLRALGLAVPGEASASVADVDPTIAWEFKPDAYRTALAAKPPRI